MSSQAFDMVPIQNENDGKVLGVLTEGSFVRTLLFVTVSCPVMVCPLVIPLLIRWYNTNTLVLIFHLTTVLPILLLCIPLPTPRQLLIFTITQHTTPLHQVIWQVWWPKVESSQRKCVWALCTNNSARSSSPLLCVNLPTSSTGQSGNKMLLYL